MDGNGHRAVVAGDDAPLRTALVRHSGLPGARLNVRLVAGFAAGVGEMVDRPDRQPPALEALLDRWAAMPEHQAPVDRPEIILPCAAVVALLGFLAAPVVMAASAARRR